MSNLEAVTTCDHGAAAVVPNSAGEPVRLVCPCGREWRVLPIDWEISVERRGGS